MTAKSLALRKNRYSAAALWPFVHCTLLIPLVFSFCTFFHLVGLEGEKKTLHPRPMRAVRVAKLEELKPAVEAHSVARSQKSLVFISKGDDTCFGDSWL